MSYDLADSTTMCTDVECTKLSLESDSPIPSIAANSENSSESHKLIVSDRDQPVMRLLLMTVRCERLMTVMRLVRWNLNNKKFYFLFRK